MELDNEELEATKKNREDKCIYCDLASGDEKELGNGNQLLIIERYNDTYSISVTTCYEGSALIEINYCPMCGRKLV